MSCNTVFCVFLKDDPAVLFEKLKSLWCAWNPDGSVFIWNAQNPQLHYCSEEPPPPLDETVVEAIHTAAGSTIDELVNSIGVDPESPVEAQEAKPMTEAMLDHRAWVIQLGEFSSSEAEMSKLLEVATTLITASTGRFLYLRDSYSYSSEIWNIPLPKIALAQIPAYPPDANSHESYEVERVI